MLFIKIQVTFLMNQVVYKAIAETKRSSQFHAHI